jgi:ComF family protein
LSEVLADPLIQLLQYYSWPVELIIPVPLDKVRSKNRGYNQAALLARPISWGTGIPYSEDALTREKITSQQVGLNVEERIENMAGAFYAVGSRVSGKTIMVVDDVITTGATINACACALIKGGAARVYGITLARSSHL